ncbi:unnamed protein product, partial [Meganyctiphanes norvegica]
MCSAGGASENGSSGECGTTVDEDITSPAQGSVLEGDSELNEGTSLSYDYNEMHHTSTNAKQAKDDIQVNCIFEKGMDNQREFYKGGGENLGSEEYGRLAYEGIRLMLNNRSIEAEELFRHHTENNLHMAMGYCYITFMMLVSFE